MFGSILHGYGHSCVIFRHNVVPCGQLVLISGNTPIVTVPASEDEDVAEELVEDGDEDPDDEDENVQLKNKAMLSGKNQKRL